MKTPYTIDCHSHSNNSPDGSNSVLQMCARAAELQLDAYAITDHCEINAYYQDGYDKMTAGSAKAVSEAKEQYAGKLNLLFGIELGQPLQDLPQAQAQLNKYPYDLVIGSLHNISGCEDFAFLDYSTCDVNAMIRRYYEELYAMAKWGGFDVLGHLTYPLRYIKGMAKVDVDMSLVEDLIRDTLRTIAEKHLAIEINTSGLRQQLGVTMPDLYYVKLFRELGGELLCIGSDSHCVEDLGKGVIDAIEIARAAGFEHITYFKERKPVMLGI